jgi:hypothetical protein
VSCNQDWTWVRGSLYMLTGEQSRAEQHLLLYDGPFKVDETME